MQVPTITWNNKSAVIIDQRKLPSRLEFVRLNNAKDVFNAIKKLKIRGAPAIGIAGAFGMYLGCRNIKCADFKTFYIKLKEVEKYIASSRPTARNLFWALERMRRTAWDSRKQGVKFIKKIMLIEAVDILEEDKKICRKIGEYGASIIKNGDVILTHCNAGGLATADFGTALACMYSAKLKGIKFSVFVDETRPVLQGSRLTAWELEAAKINATLICDNMAASLMQAKKIHKVIVGADRIAANGDVANKIGTYSLAVLCKAHKIPFYVAAPVSTFDLRTRTGKDIVIEKRDPDEVRTCMGVRSAPSNIKVYNPAFDVTPHKLITALITEKGIIRDLSVSKLRKVKQGTDRGREQNE